nr:hypothetical protein [Tanacetum cinerariifolium]
MVYLSQLLTRIYSRNSSQRKFAREILSLVEIYMLIYSFLTVSILLNSVQTVFENNLVEHLIPLPPDAAGHGL